MTGALYKAVRNAGLSLVFVGSAFCLTFEPPAQDAIPTTDPRYQEAKAIYEAMGRVVPRDGRDLPELRLRAGRSRVAQYDDKSYPPVIMLDELAYSVCSSFGEALQDCLAVLIGHELGHFSSGHEWGIDFTTFKSDQITDSGREVSSEIFGYREAEADFHGGRYGFLAGYNTFGLAGRVFTELYEAYGWDKNLPSKYPTLESRIRLAADAEKKLSEYTPMFETGHRLLLLGEYSDAIVCFRYVDSKFPSRENRNNIGVAYLLQALPLFGTDKLRFAYPIETDPQTRLAGSRGSDEDPARTALLEKAKAEFDEAIRRDGAYSTAYVNLGVVFDLLGRHDEAIASANTALRIARAQADIITEGNALLIRGIAAAEKKDVVSAQADFTAARTTQPRLASYNIGVLKGDARPESTLDCAEKTFDGYETVATKLDRFEADSVMIRPFNTSFMIASSDPNQPSIAVDAKEGTHWQATQILNPNLRKLFFIEVKPGYSEASQGGIRIGSSMDDVLAHYGCPARQTVVSARSGHYMYYKKAQIIFSVGIDNRVRGWMIFGRN